MSLFQGKEFGEIHLFDPEEGILVREAPGEGAGWWAGAPNAYFDKESNTFHLVYRLRFPNDRGRGIELRIASSDNGVSFVDIWALSRYSLNAQSVERCAITKSQMGVWQLYVSYVGADDGKWRIGLIEANEPDSFDPENMVPFLEPDDIQTEGVKDPVVFRLGCADYMLVTCAVPGESCDADQIAAGHLSGNVFNSKDVHARSGAVMMVHGQRPVWLGMLQFVGQPVPASTEMPWDNHCCRVSTILPLDTGGYIVFYDGGGTAEHNHEEMTGLAYSTDLLTWRLLSTDTAVLRSPNGSHSLRYLDMLSVGHEIFAYYELAKEDGSHELRVSVFERG